MNAKAVSDQSPEEPSVVGVRVRPAWSLALYALLVVSAGVALYAQRSPGVDPTLAQAAPWLFLAFALGFTVYRLALVMARRYSPFKAFIQIFLAALFFLLLLFPRAQGAATQASLLVSRDARVRAMAAENAGWRGARVIAWAENQSLDFVSALPSVRAGDAPTTVALQMFFRLITSTARLGSVADPNSKAAAGVGAFNLVRRSALAKSPGLEWLKMEVADDMGLGVMLKRSGARCAVLAGRDAVTLQFYPSLAAMFRALEKNGAQAPAPMMLGGLVALLAVELGFYAGFSSPHAWVQLLAMVTFVWAVTTDFLTARWLRMPTWPAVFPGLGALPLTFAMARSCLLAIKRGGVMWRGTFYPTAVVRAGQRLR